MNKKPTDILAYPGWICWLIAFFAGSREESKFHLNQGLVINIIGTAISIIEGILFRIPFGWIVASILGIVALGVTVLMVFGIVYAATGQERSLPVVGGIQILK